MYFTIPKGSTTQFCDGLKDIREDIQIFGGVSCSDDITGDDSCVFTKAYGFSETSIVIVFYGGEDFHVDSIKVTGWKPLGREFHVTKSQGSLLQELDGIPAYDVYRKYLNINNDENFSTIPWNSLCFMNIMTRQYCVRPYPAMRTVPSI